MSEVHIGNIYGPVQTNGPQYNYGPNQYVLGADSHESRTNQLLNLDSLEALSTLDAVLPRLALTPRELLRAQAALRAVDRALRDPEPDIGVAGQSLYQFTARLKEVGVLASASAELTDSIGHIATRLGHFGAKVLGLL